MHHCLQIPEIVHLICEEINQTPKHKHTLATLARTCRFFEEPALDMLWASLPCIAPLVRCFPPDTLRIYMSGLVVVDKPIIPAECARFFMYARRVKSLDIGIEHIHNGPCVHASVYDNLSVFSMGRCLVPNIKTLRWFPRERDNPSLMSHVHLFLGPKLKAIHFEIGAAETISFSLLAGLKTLYPDLECLEVKTYHNTAMHVEDISSAVCDWGSLRDIRVPSLSNTALAYVATLPGLTSLGLSNINKQKEFPELPQGDLFPNLRVLTLGCKIPSFYAEVLKSISSRPLEVLNILGDRSSRSALEDFFDTAKEYCDQSSLRTITFFDTMADKMGKENRGPFFTWEVDNYLITPKVLQPLLSFHALTEVDLDPIGSLDLNNAAVEEMAMAWPHLRRLSLGARYSPAVHPRVTLLGLLPIAEHCRNIEFLYITVDACSDVESSMFSRTRGVCNKRLVTLGVGDSPIEQPMLVASFLSHVFPGITNILIPEQEVEEEDEEPEITSDVSRGLWEKVRDYVSVLAYIRTEERSGVHMYR